MTVAISRMGSGGWGGGGGGGWGPRRFQGGQERREEQNAVLLEIFKENLRLRGIEIDEPAEAGVEAPAAAADMPEPEPAVAGAGVSADDVPGTTAQADSGRAPAVANDAPPPSNQGWSADIAGTADSAEEDTAR
jgi:hypothetical protein